MYNEIKRSEASWAAAGGTQEKLCERREKEMQFSIY